MKLNFNSAGSAGYVIMLFFLILSARGLADSGGVNYSYITKDSLLAGKDTLLLGSVINRGWKMRVGDNPEWSKAEYNDSAWGIAQSDFYVDSISGKEWTGIGWVRKYIEVDPSLGDVSIGLSIFHYGASEIYLNGKLLARFGKIKGEGEIEEGYNPLGNPIHLPLLPGKNLLAIRYSSYAIIDRTFGIFIPVYPSGIIVRIVDLNNFVRNKYDGEAENYSIQLILFSVLFTLAILHLLLYIYYSKSRPNLYYSLFALCLAGFFFLGFLMLVVREAEPVKYLIVIQIYSLSLIFSLFVTFLFSIYYDKMPRRSWIYHIAGIVIATVILMTLFNKTARGVLALFILVCLAEGVRVVVLGVKNKRDGALIIAGGVSGFLIIILFFFISYWISVRFIPEWILMSIFYFGFLSIPASMSIYLARNFSKTNEDLELKLSEIQELSEKTIAQQKLEAELRLQNERRAKELEDARQLQLSMLPKSIPQDTEYEISVYMQTAAEVGGDYYDFNQHNGDLTVAIGDATGHGAKAGLMVTTAKTLFTSYAAEESITAAFRKMSRTIKAMNLGMLYMAMSVFRFGKEKVRFSSAGMPSALIYKADKKEVEEMQIKAMPLGAFNEFPYEEREFELKSGDVLLLMTDGFPELFNSSGEMLGYDKAAVILKEVAEQPSAEIVSRFIEEINRWLKGRSQDDDITFLVIRKKT